LSHPNVPKVISTSYGEPEETGKLSYLHSNLKRLTISIVPPSYAKRVCNGLAQLGARGVSLTFSSGDGGVGDGEPDPELQTCFTNDGKNTTRFQPTFPA